MELEYHDNKELINVIFTKSNISNKDRDDVEVVVLDGKDIEDRIKSVPKVEVIKIIIIIKLKI